jgi:hypothetical protein
VHILDPALMQTAMLRGAFCPHTSTTVVRVSSGPEGPWFDPGLLVLEDVDFFLRLAFTGRPWAFLEARQCTVRFIGDNLTRSSDLSSPVTLARQRAVLAMRERKLQYCARRSDRRIVQAQVAQQAYLVGQCCAQQGDRSGARTAYLRSLRAAPTGQVAKSLAASFLPRRLAESIRRRRQALPDRRTIGKGAGGRSGE